MTGTRINSAAAALREVFSTLHLHGRALAERAAGNLRPEHQYDRPYLLTARSQWPRRICIGTGAVAFAAVASCAIVWWQLSAGSISINMVTPWLTSAIEERLGGGHRVEVGGTMLERDEAGKSALRLRDVVVRDAQGTIVASAPKAEVGLVGMGLLTGKIQADRLSLIGAAMALRIDPIGQVDIRATSEPAPATSSITSSVAVASAVASPADRSLPPVEMTADPLAAVLAWIDRLELARP